MPEHRVLASTHAHTVFRRVWANNDERVNDSGPYTTNEIGVLGLQVDTGLVYRLHATTPTISWVPLQNTDNLAVAFPPTEYAPATGTIAGHLAGIDAALGQAFAAAEAAGTHHADRLLVSSTVQDVNLGAAGTPTTWRGLADPGLQNFVYDAVTGVATAQKAGLYLAVHAGSLSPDKSGIFDGRIVHVSGVGSGTFAPWQMEVSNQSNPNNPISFAFRTLAAGDQLRVEFLCDTSTVVVSLRYYAWLMLRLG